MSLRLLLGLSILSGAQVFAAVPPPCTPARVSLAKNAVVTAEGGYDQVGFYDTKTGQALGSPASAPGGLTVLDLHLHIATLYKDPAQYGSDQVQLRWTKSANPATACLQAFDVTPSVEAPPASLQAPFPGEPSSCQRHYGSKLSDLRQ